VAHGHLSPQNIFILTEARFSDLGIFTLKKIASVYQDYTNKTCYSAPEILSGKGLLINLGLIVKRATHE